MITATEYPTATHRQRAEYIRAAAREADSAYRRGWLLRYARTLDGQSSTAEDPPADASSTCGHCGLPLTTDSWAAHSNYAVTGISCAVCGSSMTLINGLYWRCNNPSCGYQLPLDRPKLQTTQIHQDAVR